MGKCWQQSLKKAGEQGVGLVKGIWPRYMSADYKVSVRHPGAIGRRSLNIKGWSTGDGPEIEMQALGV